MGLFSKFKKFLKGENTKTTQKYSSSNYLSQKSQINQPSSETLKYPERNYSNTIQNSPQREQKNASQILQSRSTMQSTPSALSSYAKENPQYRERTRSLYERSTTPEVSQNDRLTAKLDVMTTQNQTIIELLREINMNLNYKMRR